MRLSEQRVPPDHTVPVIARSGSDALPDSLLQRPSVARPRRARRIRRPRVDNAGLPPAVRAISADHRSDFASRIEWLNRQHEARADEQTREARDREAREKALRGQVQAQVKRVKTLPADVAAMRLSVDALTKRVSTPPPHRRTTLKRRVRRAASRLLRR